MSKSVKRLLPVLFCAACLSLTGLLRLQAQQSGEKLLKFQDVEHITDAALVSDVSVAGRPVECGLFIKPPAVIQPITSFHAGDDWLRQMTISPVNRTNKTIVFAGIILHFLDVGDCSAAQPCVEAEIHLGQMPAISSFDGRTGRPFKPEHPDRPPLDWKPQATLVVHVGDFLPEIEANLSAFMPVTAVTKMTFSRGVFYFGDGMAWSLGR